MPALESKLRSQLDDVCQKAREKAEDAARSALQKRAVDAAEPHSHFTPAERELRNRLRARGRQAGDSRLTNKTQGIEQLVQELAYEYWHRMLFARLLAENHLLMHPDGVAVSLEECEELAKSEGAPNGFVLAARYASKMLPQIFRTDDVVLEVEFSPEHRLALEKLLAGVPKETFLADDSLGWVYQFWQTKRKKDVNDSGDKIDSRTLSAVTQLFTEDYMVQFLLHNTIGAWWCAQQGIQGPPGGTGIPAGNCPVEMPYLRWRDDGLPAAGKFEGWPKSLAEFTMLDPCCGSGHFLVAAFNLLVPLRMQDEKLTAEQACEAVLRKNLFGLELDPRCTQIAAFALAVAAWKYPDENGQPLGYRDLPTLNIACTGIGPQATEDEWLKLAEQSGKPMSVLSREPIMNGLRNLHALFSDAPTLGSIIVPNQLSADLITADYETLQPYLAAALMAEQADDDAHERAVAAAGMVKAAEVLAGEYTLSITNVPYLGFKRQGPLLRGYCEKHYPQSQTGLDTVLLERMLQSAGKTSTVAVVINQTWLFQPSSRAMRKACLSAHSLSIVARLGSHAFETISGEVVNVACLVIQQPPPNKSLLFSYFDAQNEVTPSAKADVLRVGDFSTLSQAAILENPGAVVTHLKLDSHSLLSDAAISASGLKTGDRDRFNRQFWEFVLPNRDWEYYQVSSKDQTQMFSGRTEVIFWQDAQGELAQLAESLKHLNHVVQNWRRGQVVWGQEGVAVSATGKIVCHIYDGSRFDSAVTVVKPHSPDQLPAIWAYCSSGSFEEAVRSIDSKLSVTTATVINIPFDLGHWQTIAAEEYPDGLPEPESNDPTQWLFHGRPEESDSPLHVAVGRLLGYRWPAELDTKMRLSKRAKELVNCCDELLKCADKDGIVCIPAIRGESSADERLLDILHAAYDAKWSNSLIHDLLTDAGSKPGTTLDDWLRNAFFEQHCSSRLFQNRPFIWQIWDGRKDGFSCLANYHKLNYKTLDNLTHSYLEGWIRKQASDAKTGKIGADLRLAAAQGLQEKLKLILAGEPPYDIFARWKPLHEQPIGWNPDLNDGVRMNIRPFVEAGILRKNPNIMWTKDRGKEPERDKKDFPWFWNGKTFTGDRVNDIHLTNAKKQAARKQ